MSVFSQGKDVKEALNNIGKAIRLHLEALKDETSGKKLVEVVI